MGLRQDRTPNPWIFIQTRYRIHYGPVLCYLLNDVFLWSALFWQLLHRGRERDKYIANFAYVSVACPRLVLISGFYFVYIQPNLI